MSYCPAIPNLESESFMIDACLARVRVDARLDEEPVLPPLETILPNRVFVHARTEHLPSADAIVKSVWSRRPGTPVADSGEIPAAPPSSSTTTERTTQARRRRWPVLLCGFVAGLFGGVALMKSPVGRQPVVQHSVQHSVAFVKRHALHVYVVAEVAGSGLLHGK